MRKVGCYSFSAQLPGDQQATRIDAIEGAIVSWLRSKGASEDQALANEARWQYPDGREAELWFKSLTADSRTLKTWTIQEPVPTGKFSTTLTLGEQPSELAVSVVLQAAGDGTALAPAHFEPHCPRVVREIVALPVEWRFGETALACEPLRLRGLPGGKKLSDLIWEPRRSLPIVVVSEMSGAGPHGFILHPGLAESLAKDLAPLARIVQADAQASWQLTKLSGREWSCFNGAVRIYWPKCLPGGSPYDHPLWTPGSLLARGQSTAEAADQLRRRLRRTLHGVSTFAVSEPTWFEEVRAVTQRAEMERRLKEARESGDAWEYAMELDRENQGLRADSKALKQENEELRSRLWHFEYGAVVALPDEAAPVTETPPEVETVADAVESAKAIWPNDLSFGADVEEGVRGLADDAGPPDKILTYLEALADLARTWRGEGRLGNSPEKWLGARNVSATRESDSIKNNAREREKRTWSDGVSSRFFDLHLKPTENTSPDRCVRIYFEYDGDLRKVIVGWVGRHP